MSAFVFDLCKYLGTWYELAHYPTWFQPNDSINTKAHYARKDDGSVSVCNTTYVQGKKYKSTGTAKPVFDNAFKVEFAAPEIQGLPIPAFSAPNIPDTQDLPNYVIDKIFMNCHGEYVFAVVTDATQDSLWVLSRYAHPSLAAYNEVMAYVSANYDRKRFVQTSQIR